MVLRAYLTDGAELILQAHTANKVSGGKPELLIDHSNLVMKFVDKLCEENGLADAIRRAIERITIMNEPLSGQAQALINHWFRQAIYLHDLGKLNPVFQRKQMENKDLKKPIMSGDSTHALLSGLLYLDIYLPELAITRFSENTNKNELIGSIMRHFLYTFAYVISRHHTYLAPMDKVDGDLTLFEEKLEKLQRKLVKKPDYLYYYRFKEGLLSKSPDGEGICEQVCKSRNNRFNDRHSPFPFYILTKLLYSTMVACDFYATNTFDTGVKPQFQYFNEQRSLQPVLDVFHQTAIYQGVQAYRLNDKTVEIDPINKLRSKLFLETEAQLMLNLKQPLYYLEAPTGSGKTFMSLNLGLKLLNSGQGYNKLIYVFPFNALIEQTKQTLNEVFPPDLQNSYRMQVVNSVTPIVTEKELAADKARTNDNGEQEPTIRPDYKTELLHRQMLQYPVTLTSHVNFFNYLFGIGRESNLAFTHLCNSVIILDEIQSYRNEIWKEIIQFLRSFTEILNMKIIIMSATLPKLDLLLEDSSVETCSLVVNREVYYQNSLFRHRVEPNFDLLKEKKLDEELLLEKVLGVLKEREARGVTTRLFIEFITKVTARSFYERLKLKQEELGIKLFELTGDDSNLSRKKVLYELGKDEQKKFRLLDVIVVATQVIEAGVDIDMDVGFKDISILDSEEQFLGRINRSCLRKDCHAYFFNMFDASRIYRKDKRTELDLRSEEYQYMLRNKDFSGFYRLCMKRINEDRSMSNLSHWSYFTSEVQKLQFEDIENRMRLITEKPYTLFIEHTVQYETDSGETVILEGGQVWDRFKYLMEDKELEFAQRKIEMSQIHEKMAYFTYSYRMINKAKPETPRIYSERVGDLFYVSNGEDYMDTDKATGVKKFNRIRYMGEEDSMLL